MDEKQLIGMSSAARYCGISVGSFAYYFYQNRTPAHTMIDNRPVWNSGDLDNWKPIKKNRIDAVAAR